MAPRDLSQSHATAMTFLNDADFLVIRPTPTTAGIRDRQNLNTVSVFVCVHEDTR